MDLSVSLLFKVLADFPPEGSYLHLKCQAKNSPLCFYVHVVLMHSEHNRNLYLS